MGKELEIKYAAREAAITEAVERDEEVCAIVTEKKTVVMETTYYDTPDGELSERRWTLRLRRENQRSVLCLKTPGAGLCRGEWETESPSVEQAAEKLCPAGAPAELKELLRSGVRPLCGAAFTRRALLLRLEDGTQAELALDVGELYRGSRRIPLFEVELELKTGAPGAMLQLAQRLADRYALQPEPKSKFIRAAGLGCE